MGFTVKAKSIPVVVRAGSTAEKRIFHKFKASTLEKLERSIFEANGRYNKDHPHYNPVSDDNPIEVSNTPGGPKSIKLKAFSAPNWTPVNIKDDGEEWVNVFIKVGGSKWPILNGDAGQENATEIRIGSSELISTLEEMRDFVAGLEKGEGDGATFHEFAKEIGRPPADKKAVKEGNKPAFKYDPDTDAYVKA